MFQNTAIWQLPNHKITEETAVYIWLDNNQAISSLQKPEDKAYWICYGQAETQAKLTELRKPHIHAA